MRFIKHRDLAVALVTLGMLGSTTAVAGDLDVGVYTGILVPGQNHELYSPSEALYKSLSPGPALGARVMYRPIELLAGELAAHGAAATVQDTGGALLYAYRAEALLLPPLTLPADLEPFLIAGIGNIGINSSNDRLGADVDWAAHTGAGFMMPLTDKLGLRADLHYLFADRNLAIGTPGGHTEFLVGVTYRLTPEGDKDGDGMVDNRDTCPDEAETINDWRDDDGCPDVLAKLTVHIDDTEGLPVEDIIVLADGKEIGRTDVNGDLTLDGLPPESAVVVSGSHFHMEPSPTSEVALAEGPNQASLEMQWLPGRVRVVTKGQDGPIADAVASFVGPKELDTSPVANGDQVFYLAPGDWMILVAADSFGTERRELSIAPDQTSMVVIEVELEPAKVEVTRAEVKILDQINFTVGSSEVDAESFGLLDEIANTLLANPHIKSVEVQGHSDSQGPAAFNLKLSQSRMETVSNYLVSKGVPEGLLQPKGFGEEQPIADNGTKEGRSVNRRVQFVILEQD